MDAFLADVSASPRNVPHELQARPYREIGVAAVAAALGLTDAAPARSNIAPSPVDYTASQAA